MSEFTTGQRVRVVRSNGQIEADWEVCFTFMHGTSERTQVRKWSDDHCDWLLKCPRTEMLAYWQNGGTAESSEAWLAEVTEAAMAEGAERPPVLRSADDEALF